MVTQADLWRGLRPTTSTHGEQPRPFDWRVQCPQDVGGRRWPAVVGRGRGRPLGTAR